MRITFDTFYIYYNNKHKEQTKKLEFVHTMLYCYTRKVFDDELYIHEEHIDLLSRSHLESCE